MKALKTLALCLALATPAFALEPLAEEPFINDSLRAGRIGDVIRKTCPTIEARMFTVWSKLEELKRYARAKGYSEAEVKAFLKDPGQKARLKAEAAAYLTEAGAVDGDAESYCKVGRDEIAKGSLIGSLLRDRG
ncbi:DUF5333 domain-containing protein [Rhodobacter sp. Har01]|uniref:DUF5333 domain-containing protein n=1 Tax=Rhodobacter sp. Har01 TaxID=2883999 RepID=UPI001D088130|nr:DUF5333 domain-containing protein [Rhodobacter sp. Har01]MCB6177382.1 DUF5333 domain-containing protein [Rhodobacter sp. Har01]